MPTPLRIAGLIEHAAKWHADTEIVSRLPEGGLHRYTYAAAHQRAKQLAHRRPRGHASLEHAPALRVVL
jgi:acyl-CoA synthetase (AMP-forming)/AMP-acid ligase II